MDPFHPEPDKSSTATKTIRLTRAELYALKMARPRKRPITLLLVALAVAALLGAALWFFRDFWLPYWLPEPDSAAPAAERSSALPVPEPAAPSAPVAAPPAPTPAPPPSSPDAAPDYLSAAPWNHPRFLEAVRAFNQSIDQYRLLLADPSLQSAAARAEEGALLSADVFESLIPDAPASVPLRDYLSQSHRLVVAVRRLSKPAPPPPAAAQPSSPPDKPADMTVDQLRAIPDFLEGGRLYNRALEQFNLYKANPSRSELLQPTEALAKQAGEKFESLKRQVTTNFYRDVDRLIHQSYGIVSACRGAQLKDSGAQSNSSFDRGTAGPSRRPPLPAYQPPPQ